MLIGTRRAITGDKNTPTLPHVAKKSRKSQNQVRIGTLERHKKYKKVRFYANRTTYWSFNL